MIINFYTFAEDHGETRVLKRESGVKPELCPQRYILKHLARCHCNLTIVRRRKKWG
jgi:hypothetical protein